jgi:hypothetical protein
MKLKININKPDPSKERIQKYKNKNGILDRYQQIHSSKGIAELLRRNKRLFVYITTILILLLLWLLDAI